MKSKIYILLIIGVTICTHFKSFSQANRTLSNLISPTAVNQDLLPNNNNTRNLGSLSNSWKTLFIDNNIYLRDSLFINNKGIQNTFTGQRAGYSITTGSNNAAFGFHALYNNRGNSFNSAFGSNALANNTASGNSAFGYRALFTNTTGSNNAAHGMYALYLNTTGQQNTAAGYAALYNNTTGNGNVVNGSYALYNNISGYGNVAIGTNALRNNRTGSDLVAIGDSALFSQNNDDGAYGFNTAVGTKALYSNTFGLNLTALGGDALFTNTTGYNNTAVGTAALYENTTGNGNTAVGEEALSIDTSGEENTAVGEHALNANKTGSYNTAEGIYSLGNNTTGSFNTCIGSFASTSDGTVNNYTGIGAHAGSPASASNMVELGDENVTIIRGEVNFSTYSDERIKNNIKENVPGLAFINILKPVTYNIDLTKQSAITYKGYKRKDSLNKTNYAGKTDIEKQLKTGFIAQEVDAAAKKINYDFSGVVKPQNANDLYSLRYAEFVVPLVKAVQELSKTNDNKDSIINTQQTQINNLETRLSNIEAIMNISAKSTPVSSASLAQNTPNPFGSVTSIGYNLPQSYASAKIIITDKKGVALKQISLQTKGKGTVNVDASTFVAGVYQYSLYVNNKLIDTKQMVMAK